MSLQVEHLTPRDSLFAQFDARWKLAALILAVAMIAALQSPIVLAAALGISLLMAMIARVPGRWFWARIGVLMFALLPFLLILPLTVERGGSVFDLFGLQLPLAGLIAAVELICKTMAIVALVLILSASSPLHVTFRAAQRLRVPGLFVLIAMLSYRYIFLLLDELGRLRIALRVRGFRNRANRHSYRTIGQVTGSLLVRGTERAERVSHAMRCRGFDGRFRSLDEFRTKGIDVAMFLSIVGLFVLLVVLDRVL